MGSTISGILDQVEDQERELFLVTGKTLESLGLRYGYSSSSYIEAVDKAMALLSQPMAKHRAKLEEIDMRYNWDARTEYDGSYVGYETFNAAKNKEIQEYMKTLPGYSARRGR